MEFIDGGETVRFDRLVICGEEAWIIDYADALPDENPACDAAGPQVRAARTLFPGMRIAFDGGLAFLPPSSEIG